MEAVIEVGQIYQGQGGGVFLLHPFRRGGDPFRRSNACRWAPEGREGEGAEIRFDLIPHGHGLGVDVEVLRTIRRVERARGDCEVRGGVHVIPPEELGAGEARHGFPQGVPDFFTVDYMVRLLPEADFGALTVIPAVGDDAMLRRRGAC